jgi:hypothetical protein
MSDNQNSAPTVGWLWVAGAVVATVALYLVLLGWNAEKTRSPGGGQCTGPYEAWQPVALAAGMVLVVAVASWRGHGWAAVVSCALSVTVLWSLDAATVDDPCQSGANLWPVGAVLVLLGSAAGLAAVAAGVTYMRSSSGGVSTGRSSQD